MPMQLNKFLAAVAVLVESAREFKRFCDRFGSGRIPEEYRNERTRLNAQLLGAVDDVYALSGLRLRDEAINERNPESCPCVHVAPCSGDCSCAYPAKGGGCEMCCSHDAGNAFSIFQAVKASNTVEEVPSGDFRDVIADEIGGVVIRELDRLGADAAMDICGAVMAPLLALLIAAKGKQEPSPARLQRITAAMMREIEDLPELDRASLN